jgi:hypothetical protein
MVNDGFGRIDNSGIIQMLPHFPGDIEKVKVICTNCRASFKKKSTDGAERVVLECCRGCGKRTLEIKK